MKRSGAIGRTRKVERSSKRRGEEWNNMLNKRNGTPSQARGVKH
jgi:hypothetical protein